MKKIGTFYDCETQMDYDIYTINAVILKEFVKTSYNLTPLKINLFNSSSYVAQDVSAERSNIDVDFATGTVNNPEYFNNSGANYRAEAIQKAMASTEDIHNRYNAYHLLGFETTPFVISLDNRDTCNMSNLELIDGFKRMFWTTDIPDRDVFLKVYDIMDTTQWVNAMLLYNSWKIPMGADSFSDRGFKLGLFKHFNIDLTVYNARCYKLIHTYISPNPFNNLKNNSVFDKDIQLLLDLFTHFTAVPEGTKLSPLHGMYLFLISFADTLSNIRKAGQGSNSKVKGTPITFSQILDFLNTPVMQKHCIKINSMSVPGRIETYASAKMIPLVFSYLRFALDVDSTPLPPCAYLDSGELTQETIPLFWASSDTITTRFEERMVARRNRTSL